MSFKSASYMLINPVNDREALPDLNAKSLRPEHGMKDVTLPNLLAEECASASLRPNDPNDDFILAQVSRGDHDSLALLFRRHARPVFNVANRILRDQSEAEDLVQDLFLYLSAKAGTFDPRKGSAASWIIQLAYHRALDRRKYLNVRHHYTGIPYEETKQPTAKADPIIDQMTAKTLLRNLKEDLTPEQYQTLELHIFDGYTFLEIAERTDQALENVRHHYYRGLERLRSSIFSGKNRSK